MPIYLSFKRITGVIILMKLLYITYIDFTENPKSGSAVRPQKMYKAFLEHGVDVKLLECQQNKRKQRKEKVKEILHWLDSISQIYVILNHLAGQYLIILT